MPAVRVNGEERRFDGTTSISAMLEELAVRPDGVAVEINRQIIPRGRHGEHVLEDGDEIEIVTFVGGG